MPNLNHSGPEGKGAKTGRKLGRCIKSEDELNQIGEIGKGQAKKRHSENLCGQGKGKRINYFQTINKKGE